MIHIRNQRGAMFGLDARIALAIFGGLSIITGAALFSAISQTTTTALVTELDNIGKGYTNYVLDTGVDTSDIEDLKSDTVAGWQGPYISLDDDTAANSNIPHPKYGALSIVRFADTEWADGVGDASTATNDWVWIQLTGVDVALLARLDQAVDGTAAGAEDGDIGTIRYDDTTASGNETMFYKVSTAQ